MMKHRYNQKHILLGAIDERVRKLAQDDAPTLTFNLGKYGGIPKCRLQRCFQRAGKLKTKTGRSQFVPSPCFQRFSSCFGPKNNTHQ